MATRELKEHEVDRFAEKFGTLPKHERAFVSALFCHAGADWRMIQNDLPEMISVKSIIEVYLGRLEGVFDSEAKATSLYQEFVMPQVESLGLLAKDGNELLMTYVEIVLRSEKRKPLARHGLEGMERILRNPSEPARWDDGRHPCMTGSSRFQAQELTDKERTKMLESVCVVEELLGEGQAYGLARLMVGGDTVTRPIVEHYWRKLDTLYRTSPRKTPEEAACIAKLDVTLNAFCAAFIGKLGPAEVLDNYLEFGPSVVTD